MSSESSDLTGGETFDLDARELCPDGACLGLIGPDGRCKVCGTRSPNESTAGTASVVEARGEAVSGAGEDVQDATHSAGDRTAAEEDASSTAPEEGVAAEDVFDPSRRELCPDGTCLGVIGPDGRCSVCGRAAPAAPQGA